MSIRLVVKPISSIAYELKVTDQHQGPNGANPELTHIISQM